MARPTKIERIETMLWNRWLLVRIYCEDGTVGIGEGGVHGWQRPTQTMLEVMSAYLRGQDPHRIEHHYQFLYRSSHFMGAVVQGALSAIDIALWDIKGKRLGVPIYDLMGGKTRDKVRCYVHVHGDTIEKLTQDAALKTRQGFTAVRFAPWGRDFYLHKSYSAWAEEAVRRVGAVREAVGPDIDLCVELHRQMNPAESIALGRRLEQFHPFFYEDPMLPDSPARMGDVQERCALPIATGERFTTIFEFQQLLENKGCAYVRPGPLSVRRPDRLQEGSSHGRGPTRESDPAQPLSPVSTAACVQLDACIPNFALQEYTGESEPPKSELLQQPLRLEDGYLIVPEGPGLGIALNDAAIAKYPPVDKVLDTPLGYDGSVQDR